MLIYLILKIKKKNLLSELELCWDYLNKLTIQVSVCLILSYVKQIN